jgi:hypothetical protein
VPTARPAALVYLVASRRFRPRDSVTPVGPVQNIDGNRHLTASGGPGPVQP